MLKVNSIFYIHPYKYLGMLPFFSNFYELLIICLLTLQLIFNLIFTKFSVNLIFYVFNIFISIFNGNPDILFDLFSVIWELIVYLIYNWKYNFQSHSSINNSDIDPSLYSYFTKKNDGDKENINPLDSTSTQDPIPALNIDVAFNELNSNLDWTQNVRLNSEVGGDIILRDGSHVFISSANLEQLRNEDVVFIEHLSQTLTVSYDSNEVVRVLYETQIPNQTHTTTVFENGTIPGEEESLS